MDFSYLVGLYTDLKPSEAGLNRRGDVAKRANKSTAGKPQGDL